jgi:hypothetical protein
MVPVLRIRDVYPGSWFLTIPDPGSQISDLGSRIPDPKTSTKERGEKNNSCHTCFGTINFAKLKLFYFWNTEEKDVGQVSKNYRTFYSKKL